MRLTHILAAALLCGLALSGCTRPTERTLKLSADDTVVASGTANQIADMLWDLSFQTTEGLTCTGMLTHDADRRMQGPISCSDGRDGSVAMLFNNRRGLGSAKIGSDTFLATIGDT